MGNKKQKQELSLEEKLAVLYVFTAGSHHALANWPKGSYENFSYGIIPTDRELTKKATKDIEENGINWLETKNAYDNSCSCYEGTDQENSTVHFYSADIVSNSGNTYRFSVDIEYRNLADIFIKMENLKESSLI